MTGVGGPDGAAARVAWAAIILAQAALSVRQAGWPAVVATAAAGAAGLMVAVPPARRAGVGAWVVSVVVGCAAFGAVRLGWWQPGVPATVAGAGGGLLAAVAEEAVFRRATFGRLERLGAGWAVAVSAAAFALVHVPSSGWGVVPVDLAAGVLLGWQRWVTGGWTAPAVTHAVANLVQMG